MAEQFNHKYELLFGQPISFFEGTPTTQVPFRPEQGIDSRYLLSNYVDVDQAKALKLTEHNIDFDIVKTKEQGRESKITIYNINDSTRRWLEAKAGDNPILILNAGYEDTPLNLIFQGEVIKVRDSFQGHTRRTEILLQQNFRNLTEAFTTRTYRKGTKASQIVRDVIADLKLPEGTIYYKDLDSILFERPVVLNGKSYEVLKPILQGLGQKLFIEDGTINIIPDNYVERDGRFVFELNNNNLIGSPSPKTDTEGKQEKESGNRDSLSVKTTLNGAIQIGNLVALTSKYHNGVYEVETVRHMGSYEGSEWSTTLDIKPINGWEVRR